MINKTCFEKIAEFENDGSEWSGYSQAETFCASKNLSIGSAQRDAPTALFGDGGFVSKWRGLSDKDKKEMWGFIECVDKRNGKATVWKRKGCAE